MPINPEQVRAEASRILGDGLNSEDLETVITALWIRFDALHRVLEERERVEPMVKLGIDFVWQQMGYVLGESAESRALLARFEHDQSLRNSIMDSMRTGIDDSPTDFVPDLMLDSAKIVGRCKFEVSAVRDIEILTKRGPDSLLGGM